MAQSPARSSVPSTDHPLAGAAKSWLDAFQECVRSRDYGRARTLFDPGIVSYGTQVNSAEISIDDIEREQWREVWPRIRDFTYRQDEARVYGNEHCLCVLTPWDSTAVHVDGATTDRTGRTTFIIEQRDGRWVCVHFHSSLTHRP